MKCFVAVLVLALAAVALTGAQPVDVESVEPTKTEVAASEPDNAARDKRGLVLGAYTAPIAYSAYSAPLTYSSAYSYPYAYSGYSSYPYYSSAYSAPYYLG